MNEKKLTALQSFAKKLQDEGLIIYHTTFKFWLENALKTERNQIEQAFDDGYSRMSGWSMSDDYFDDNFQSDL